MKPTQPHNINRRKSLSKPLVAAYAYSIDKAWREPKLSGYSVVSWFRCSPLGAERQRQRKRQCMCPGNDHFPRQPRRKMLLGEPVGKANSSSVISAEHAPMARLAQPTTRLDRTTYIVDPLQAGTQINACRAAKESRYERKTFLVPETAQPVAPHTPRKGVRQHRQQQVGRPSMRETGEGKNKRKLEGTKHAGTAAARRLEKRCLPESHRNNCLARPMLLPGNRVRWYSQP